MTNVTDSLNQISSPVFLCDFTPPPGSDPALLDGASELEKTDFSYHLATTRGS